MDMQAIIKSAAIGAALLIVFGLLGLIPCVGCITFLLSFAVYIATGVLAAQWMIKPSDLNSGATNGAVAAVVAALVAGVVNAVISTAYFALTGTDQMAQIIADLPPEQLAVLSEVGLDPAMLAGGMGIAGAFGISLVCCGLWAVIAAIFGAAGGAFWGSRKANQAV